MCDLCEAKKMSIQQAILILKDLIVEHNSSVNPEHAIHTVIMVNGGEGIITGNSEFINRSLNTLSQSAKVVNDNTARFTH